MTTAHASNLISTKLFNRLAYFGVAPFVVGLAMTGFGVSLMGVDGRLWFTGYSSVILSFLCGIWWGGALNRPEHRHRFALIVLSNLVCLLGWMALLLYRTPVALPLLAACFLFVERAEAYLKPNRAPFSAYFSARTRVTALVVFCHLVMIFLLLRE